MKVETEKSVTKQSKAVAGASPARQVKEGSDVQFEDRRSEVVGQKELAGKADSSPQAGRIAQLQAVADGSAAETIQRQGPEEEELLQGKFETIQKQEEEEELLQGKFETIQRKGAEEEEELLQGKFETIQKQGIDEEEIQAKSATVQKKDEKPVNNTGLPDTLKSGIENLSGLSLDDVKVHYNSPKPAQLQAHAFAHGTDIHMAPGQEQHLPHEAWHVVQQKQGRVRPTKQLKGKVNVNDDAGLEKEADVMGAKVVQVKENKNSDPFNTGPFNESAQAEDITQLRAIVSNSLVTATAVMQRMPIKTDHGTWKSDKYDDIPEQPTKDAVKDLESKRLKNETPEWGPMKRTAKKKLHKVKKFLGGGKDKTLVDVYNKEQVEQQRNNAMGKSRFVEPAISATSAVAKAGIKVGGAAAALPSVGASVPAAMALSQGMSAAAKSAKKKARAHNEEKAMSAYQPLNQQRRGETEEQAMERVENEQDLERYNRTDDSNVDYSKKPIATSRGKAKYVVDKLAKGTKKLVGKGVSMALDEADLTGTLGEKAGDAGNFLGGKVIDKAKGKAREKINDHMGGGYGRLQDENDEEER